MANNNAIRMIMREGGYDYTEAYQISKEMHISDNETPSRRRIEENLPCWD
mgnify:CR=1 FL=1